MNWIYLVSLQNAVTEFVAPFIDANGLHEMNNDRGHEAGDDMLRAIAEEIRNRFDSKHAYRLGGDEFVIFAVDEVEPKIIHHSRTMTIALEQRDITFLLGWRGFRPL